MNIKSLLLGSAAAAVAVSAHAADAIVIAEPEPMEYVRICDTYGTGFFYIPGTETCLKIGGLLRYQMEYNNNDEASDYTFGKLARFAPNFTAKNSTEWGTLTSYAEVEFNWTSNGAFSRGTTAQSTNLAHAYISLDNGSGTFLVGKTDTLWHNTAIGGLSAGGIFDAKLGNNTDVLPTSRGLVSYTFNAGNGLTASFGAVETESTEFEPNLEAVVRYSQGWGVVVGGFGYDNVNGEWGAKLGGEVKFSPVTVGLQAVYGSAADSAYGGYYANGAFSNKGTSEWAVAGYVKAALTEKLAAKASLTWYDGVAGWGDAYQAVGGFEWKPVSGLAILPEVRYTKAENAAGVNVDEWRAGLRFNRSF